jgi:2-oxoglutarate dehydrogenase E2 component (dihydrolipoamide succinyltransferase)
MIEIKVPTVGESISEVQLLRWNKKTGDYVERDEVIAELESEKATFEVNAEKAGVLTTIAAEGDQLKIGELLATIDDTAKASPAKVEITAPKPPAVATVQAAPSEQKPAAPKPSPADVKATPLASALLAEKKVDPTQVKATGPQGKIVKRTYSKPWSSLDEFLLRIRHYRPVKSVKKR